jgi:hypothetical protein
MSDCLIKDEEKTAESERRNQKGRQLQKAATSAHAPSVAVAQGKQLVIDDIVARTATLAQVSHINFPSLFRRVCVSEEIKYYSASSACCGITGTGSLSWGLGCL